MGSGGIQFDANDTLTVARLGQKTTYVGTTEPVTMYAGMHWFDSANNIEYIRNKDNNAWLISLNQALLTTSGPTFDHLHITKANPEDGIVITATTGTNANWMKFVNSGGNYFFGVANSVGERLGTGGTAYSFQLLTESARDLQLGTNNNVRVTIPNNLDGFTFGTLQDTNLYRASANILATDDTFLVDGAYVRATGYFYKLALSAATENALVAKLTGNAYNNFVIATDGTMTWGTGAIAGDTNLYRSAANTLKTDDSFVIGGTFTMPNNTAIYFLDSGGTVRRVALNSNSDNMYYGMVDVGWGGYLILGAGDLIRFNVNGVSGTHLTAAEFNYQGQLQLPVTGSTAGLLIGGDVLVFRSAANVFALGTGDSFQLGDANPDTSSYAMFGVTRPATADNMSYIAMTKDSTEVWAFGINASHNLIIGNAGGGKLIPTPRLILNLAGQMALTTTGSTGGILIGGDANLFRSAANELTTNDDFVVRNSATDYYVGILAKDSIAYASMVFRKDGVRHAGVRWNGSTLEFINASPSGTDPDLWVASPLLVLSIESSWAAINGNLRCKKTDNSAQLTLEGGNSKEANFIQFDDGMLGVYYSLGAYHLIESASHFSVVDKSWTTVFGVTGTGTAHVTGDGTLSLIRNASAGLGGVLLLRNSASSATGNYVDLRFCPNSNHDTRYSVIRGIDTDGVNNRIDLSFITGNGASITEKMRLTYDGKLILGGTTGVGSFSININNPSISFITTVTGSWFHVRVTEEATNFLEFSTGGTVGAEPQFKIRKDGVLYIGANSDASLWRSGASAITTNADVIIEKSNPYLKLKATDASDGAILFYDNNTLTITNGWSATGDYVYWYANTDAWTSMYLTKAGALNIRQHIYFGYGVVSGYLSSQCTGALRITHTSGQSIYIRPDENGAILFFENPPAGAQSMFLKTLSATAEATLQNSSSLNFTGKYWSGGVSNDYNAAIYQIMLAVTPTSELYFAINSGRVMSLDSSGVLWIGSTKDTNLYRYAADSLATLDDFRIQGTSKKLYIHGGASGGNASIWNPSNGTPQLQTDDFFIFGNSIQVGQGATANAYIYFGPSADVNLYWASASLLKTDDSFQAAGYKSSDGTDGVTADVVVAVDNYGATITLHYKNGLYVGAS